MDFLFTISEDSSSQSKAEPHNYSTVSGCMTEDAFGKCMWVQEGYQNFWLELRCITSYKINTEHTVAFNALTCSLNMPNF